VRSDLVINTLPGDVDPDDVADADLGDVLMEVPYDPWPTPRAARWAERDGLVVSGLEMLLHQAIEQVRIFATGVEGGRLDREDEVIAAMRKAVGLKLGRS
jgi:shikimate dehydrogenase